LTTQGYFPDSAGYTGTATITADIKEVLRSPRSSIGEGDIESNSRELEQDLDKRAESIWDRISKNLDLSGPDWVAGCFGQAALDYYQLDKGNPAYYLDTRKRVFYDRNDNRVPDALVRPGQYVQVPQIFLGLPSTILIKSVQWSYQNGLQLGIATADRLAQIEFELAAGA
jgi:hypothetical protein